MIKSPAITVLMPTYNGAKLLKPTIDSILNQTFADFEFLIINDYSPDTPETDAIIEQYNDPRIKYIHNEKNLGISGSSNRGIELAQGKYIARQDHDDISLPTRLEEQYEYMEANPEIGICGTFMKSFGEGLLKNKVTTYPKDSDDIKAALFSRCSILHPASMMKKELFDKHEIQYDTSYKTANDVKLWMDASEFTEFYNIPKVLFRYRKHNNRTSKKQNKIALEERNRLFEIKFRKIGIALSPAEKDLFYEYIIKFKAKREIFTIEKLKEIETLLTKLVEANSMSEYYPKREFAQVIGEFWFRRCLNFMTRRKKSIKRIYKKSSLSKYNKTLRKDQVILFKFLSAFLPKQKDIR